MMGNGNVKTHHGVGRKRRRKDDSELRDDVYSFGGNQPTESDVLAVAAAQLERMVHGHRWIYKNLS
jgi:hypothetical protein